MPALPRPIRDLIEAFRSLPGVGEKNAQRFVFSLLQRPTEEVKRFAAAIAGLPDRVTRCHVCGLIDETSPCRFCRDSSRDPLILCIVAETPDVGVIEQSGAFRGRYHVLGGVLDPLNGVTPDRLNLHSLIGRIKTEGVKEVIIGTNPDLEGETTALHLKKLLRPTGVTVTRLGRGLPMGASLEYADEVTITNAVKGRQAM